jgi:large subunit ribosomal protein L25
MRKDITVAAGSRDSRGKNEARRLRTAGSMPAVVYGGSERAVAVAVDPKEVGRILNSKAGHNTIFNLSIAGGETTPVMIVDWQFDPIKDTLLHVDLKRIDLTKRIAVKVPVITHGEPQGVKVQGGIHELVAREVEIECLPDDIPEHLVVEVGELLIGQAVRASDIPLTSSIRLVSNPDAVISHVVTLRIVEEAAPAAAAEAEAVAPAEPEVIKKGKKEVEGAVAAEPAPKKAAESTPKKK